MVARVVVGLMGKHHGGLAMAGAEGFFHGGQRGLEPGTRALVLAELVECASQSHEVANGEQRMGGVIF